eukprot:3527328-Rhodomonas_salina.1
MTAPAPPSASLSWAREWSTKCPPTPSRPPTCGAQLERRDHRDVAIIIMMTQCDDGGVLPRCS